jgi:hypothetical protein
MMPLSPSNEAGERKGLSDFMIGPEINPIN